MEDPTQGGFTPREPAALGGLEPSLRKRAQHRAVRSVGTGAQAGIRQRREVSSVCLNVTLETSPVSAHAPPRGPLGLAERSSCSPFPSPLAREGDSVGFSPPTVLLGAPALLVLETAFITVTLQVARCLWFYVNGDHHGGPWRPLPRSGGRGKGNRLV